MSKRKEKKLKRTPDAGLEYMISLSINPAKNLRGVEDQLAKASDKSTAKEVIKEIEIRADQGDGRLYDNQTFYALKNRTLDLSMALSSAFDGDILRKACNWIVKNKACFGNTILEIGCDCGIMSCFLAQTFPDAQITAIDRCPEGINNAKQLAEKLGVENVRFQCVDVKDIDEQYDTVFSMRTVHENHADHDDEDLMNELQVQAKLFQKSLCSYANILSSKLKKDGLLISIERIGRNALLLGWMQALEEAGLTFKLDEYEELVCKEIGEDSTFEAFVSYKTEEKTASAYELFMYACTKYMNFSKSQYIGWEAKIVFDYKHGDLIDGYIVEDMQTHMRNKLSLWKHKFDDTGIIVYQNNNGNVVAAFFDISQEEELKKSLKEAINQEKAIRSHRVEKLFQ